MGEQMKRIASFLSQYVNFDDGGMPDLPADPILLKAAITLLLEKKIMTVEALRMEALKEADVIVPWELFPEHVQAEVLR